MLAYDFKTGKRLWADHNSGSEKGRKCARGADRLEGPRLRRQRRRRLQGRQGADVRARREDGQNRLGILSRAQGRGRSDARARRRLAARYLDLEKHPGVPISGGGTWTSTTLDPRPGCFTCPVGNPAPDFANSVREGDNLFTGSVVVLDAKTGAYKNHFKLVPKDWHDWDVSNPPALIETTGARSHGRLAEGRSPLRLRSRHHELLYRSPVTGSRTWMSLSLSARTSISVPASTGGAEWNSPAYDPPTNLIFAPEVEWCTTVKLQTQDDIAAAPPGQPWSAKRFLNPFNFFGASSRDSDRDWAGWLYAIDADTGVWKWRLKSNYPIFRRRDADGRRRRVLRRPRRQLLPS